MNQNSHRGAAVLKVKGLYDLKFCPSEIVTDHRVEQREEFSHAGNDDDFGALAGAAQAIGEATQDGIETNGGERGHVEHAADRGASAADGALAGGLSGVVV